MIRTFGWVPALILTSAATIACNAGSGEQNDAAEGGTPVMVATASDAAAGSDTIVVYKTPTCGCCSKWVDHVEDNGFVAVTHDITDQDLAARKHALGVPAGRVSCHTATINGYTIEGHVPADLIRRLLTEKPAGVKGLAVPGMPVGSPGMESIVKQKYDVLSFDANGNVAVYAQR